MSKTSEYKKADLIWEMKYFLSSYFFGFPKEILLFFKGLFAKKTQPERKFIIFSTGRTGSTLLVDLLNSNADLFCDGEILKHRFLNPLKVLDTHSKMANKKIYGFKLLTHHIKDIQWGAKRDSPAFLQKLVDDGYKIIYLERKHRLNQSLSMMYAILRNDWHKQKGTKGTTKKEMTVDLTSLNWWMNGFDELNAFEKKTLKTIPHIHVVYENDLANPANHQAMMQRLCHFLDIKQIEPKTDLRKITPKLYKDFILNADEMVAHFKGTKYEHYLEGQMRMMEEEVS